LIATILLVFPLVLLYLYLSVQNKNIVAKEETENKEETCAYCRVSRSIH